MYESETGFYYLGSRYYDPEVGRFINADDTEVLKATPLSLTDKNLFAYCDNNPVMRKDNDGAFWETAFDLISLGMSVMDVVSNPTDPWAWAGLVGDAVDLIPFVTGVGEITKAVKTVDKIADSVDNVGDIAKVATKGTPNQIGKMGETLAGINPKAKVKIEINGRFRIPDAMTPTVLTEVKNVKYISNTRQLRDFADYAKKTNRTLELFVRPTTKISKTVIDAGWNIRYLW